MKEMKEMKEIQEIQEIKVELGERSYPVVIGGGMLAKAGAILRRYTSPGRCLLVTNPTVERLYASQVETSLAAAGYRVFKGVVSEGEQAKSLEQASYLYDLALGSGVERGTPVVALGGGVVGDLAGFVAATLMRGLPLFQFPTTLLAQVDSSVGGKVAINHSSGKNLIGSFYQPQAVVTDLGTLNTLPLSELQSGMAEVIKYGLMAEESLFAYLEENMAALLDRSPENIGHIVVRSCGIKASVVVEDEREGGLRQILNLGHTFAHALETLGSYSQINHGQAVAIGLVMAAGTSMRLGRLAPRDGERVRRLVAAAGMETVPPPEMTREAILEVMARDKKNRGGRITLVLPVEIGRVEVVGGFEAEKAASWWPDI